MNLGYGLIGAYAFVFFGSAVRLCFPLDLELCSDRHKQILTAWYEHLTFRAGAMVRGGLITLIYRKMMRLPTNDLGESSAVTLMGNDVETLAERLHQVLVESWANTLTVGIAIYLLAIQLGPVCVAPIIMAIGTYNLLSSHHYVRATLTDGLSFYHPVWKHWQVHSTTSKGLPRSDSGSSQFYFRGPGFHEVRQNARLHRKVHRHHCKEARRRAFCRQAIPDHQRLHQLYK